MSRYTHQIQQLKQTVKSGTLSPFIFDSFLDYQKQRRSKYGMSKK
jgi:hypothetical protein